MNIIKSMKNHSSMNITLPNIDTNIIPSKSSHLSHELFSKYLDIILSTSNNLFCKINSIFSSDYYIEINFINYSYNISDFLELSIKECIQNNTRFFILPIRLIMKDSNEGHANLIILDTVLKRIEFFEPHGILNLTNIFYDIELHIIHCLSFYFPILDIKSFSFQNIQQFCPLGLQQKQNLIDTKSGHCLAWVLLIIHLRILNIILPIEYIIDFLQSIDIYVLDQYIKLYISQVENTFINSPSVFKFTKKIAVFKLSNKEISQIQPYLINLIKQLYVTTDTNRKQKILQEILLYRNFPNFYQLFLTTI